MKSFFYYILFFVVFTAGFNYSFSQTQDDREQKPGKPKKSQSMNTAIKGVVTSKATGQIVPNADITVTETSQQKIINQSKANASGVYEVSVPKGMEIEVKAQAPEFFYDAFKIKVAMDDTTNNITKNLVLPSELQLRLNFPTNKYDDPYPNVLDDNGIELEQTWQSAISSVADDLNKYREYLKKVVVTGHTDEDGSEESNIKLGHNRALFLMNELQKRGVSEDLFEIKSSGKSELLAKRDGEDSKMWKKRCRRVVMTKIMK